MIVDIYKLYRTLRGKYGKPSGQWSLWCKRPKSKEEKEQIIIESILTQRANWKNVSLAVNNLKNADKIGLKQIISTDDAEIQSLIRPSGFYKTKSVRLRRLASFVVNGCGGIEEAIKMPCHTLRERLLSLNGIGDETADDILLYAFEKPVFVIDEYTRRLVKKLQLTDNLSYRHLQEFFEKGLDKKNYALYQDFHALIVIDGKSAT